ncbi:hypothetical protein, partial [Moellerella wisconsensis]|uniref:hypothetical protein n=1 Tax=Moellerella wisconsensis TaxID=158849 RepID=UPI0030760306
ELDLNQRPSGYEPDELPDCSIPRLISGTILRMRSDASFFVHFFGFFTRTAQKTHFMRFFYSIVTIGLTIIVADSFTDFFMLGGLLLCAASLIRR